MARDRGAAWPLLWVWVGLIVYASLYPFTGWRWPPGAGVVELLRLPWPRYLIGFDVAANVLGYAPLGYLVFVARWRDGDAWLGGVLVALAGGGALSYAMEVTQHLLPQRVPSALDAVLNLAGAGAGAALAALADAAGWLRRWQRARERWLSRGMGGATALLLLWPVALLFPSPVPLGLGQIGAPLRQALARALVDVDAAAPLADWLARRDIPAPPLPALLEGLTTLLGLLAPCLLGSVAARWRRQRTGLAVGATAIAVGVTTLSTALNFGPEHALAWFTPAAASAMALALVLALAARTLTPRGAGALAVAVLAGLIVLIHAAPANPYFAWSLQAWEQGRFVRFHGLAQWVGWLWPYAALAWVLAYLGGAARHRVGSRGFP